MLVVGAFCVVLIWALRELLGCCNAILGPVNLSMTVHGPKKLREAHFLQVGSWIAAFGMPSAQQAPVPQE